jgi:tetratricopeptide (TPR) repeat protein
MSVDEAQEIYRRGESLYVAGDYRAAAEVFGEVRAHPDFPSDGQRELEWNLGMCFARLGERDRAIGHFEAGGWPESQYAEHLPPAPATPEQEARGLMDEARALYEAGDYDGAANAFTMLLLHPGLPTDGLREVRWNLGMCAARAGDRENAVRYFQEGGWPETEYGQHLPPGGASDAEAEARGLLERANDLYNSGQYSPAADAYVELLLHPGLPAGAMREIHWNVGMCFFRLNNDQLGREHMSAGGWSESDYGEAYQRVVSERGS